MSPDLDRALRLLRAWAADTEQPAGKALLDHYAHRLGAGEALVEHLLAVIDREADQ